MTEPKTWLEIYQPVIVGLGAVVLGLLANGLLEWWRTAIQRRQQVAVIRKAIFAEILNISRVTANTVKNFDENQKSGLVGVLVSSYLLHLDREKIGCLSRKEIESLSELIGNMAAIIQISDIQKNEHSHADVHFIPVNDRTREHSKKFVSQYADLAEQAKAVFGQSIGKA